MTKKWDRAELEELYWTEHLATTEIADIKGVSRGSVFYAMKKLGIKRRTPSEAHKLAYSKGRTGIKDDNRPENLVAMPNSSHNPLAYRQVLQQRIRDLEEQLKLSGVCHDKLKKVQP